MTKELTADLPHFLSPSSSSYPPLRRNHHRRLLRCASLLCFSSPTLPLWLCLRFPSPPTTQPPSPFALPPWPAAFSAHGFFLLDPPSASLLSLSSTGDLPCSLFFLYCRSLLTGAVVAGSVVLPAESLRSPSPPYFPLMPPVTAHFFCLCTLHSRKHSHGNEHDHDNNRDTSEEGGDEEDDEENTSDPEVHGAPMYQEFIAGEERKEPPGEATLGNINAGLQKDPAAPNYDAVNVIFIVVTLLCRGDAFPPPSSSSPSPEALAP